MSFTAKYRGVCEECGGDVLPDQEATYVGPRAEGAIRHVRCPGENQLALKNELCPHCFLELPNNGECECQL